MSQEFELSLSDLESAILAYIETHPGLTAEDVAAIHGHNHAAYSAIYFLIFHSYIDRDPFTSALTARLR